MRVEIASNPSRDLQGMQSGKVRHNSSRGGCKGKQSARKGRSERDAEGGRFIPCKGKTRIDPPYIGPAVKRVITNR